LGEYVFPGHRTEFTVDLPHAEASIAPSGLRLVEPPTHCTTVGAMPPSIARNEAVDRDQLLDFVRPRHRVILVTRRSDGSAQLSPVSAGVDDEGRVVVSTYPERAKVRNLRRDPQ